LTLAILLPVSGAGAQFSGLVGEVAILYPNQDFENEKQDWGFWPSESKTKVELDSQIVQHGKQSLRVTAVDAGDRAFVLAGWAPYEADVMYRLTVHARKDASVPDSALSYFINFDEEQGKPIKSRQHPAMKSVERVGDWQRWSSWIGCLPMAKLLSRSCSSCNLRPA